MEGVGARFGRSSTRYGGPTTVFTGPIRKWKKKWVQVPQSNSNHQNHTVANGTVNGSNGSSHLLLYKWTPMAPSQTKDGSQNDNSSNDGNVESKNSDRDDGVVAEEPPRRKFKYIPTIVLEEQKNESEQMDDETKPVEGSVNTGKATSKSDGYDGKPDINDVPMDEDQATENSPVHRQDLNERTLDLSLGLKAHDGENESADDQLERV